MLAFRPVTIGKNLAPLRLPRRSALSMSIIRWSSRQASRQARSSRSAAAAKAELFHIRGVAGEGAAVCPSFLIE
jgi:hypothetical protein